MTRCSGGKHRRVENKDGTWPDTCQCGKVNYSKHESLPPLRVHITDGVGSADKVGG